MSQHIWPILRSIIAIIIGYLVLAFTNMAFVTLIFVQPILTLGPIATIASGVPYTFVCSFMGGYLVARIARRSEIKHGAILAGIMTLVTIISMIIAIAIEPLWYKISYLVVMAPAAVLGGYVRNRRKQLSKRQNAN